MPKILIVATVPDTIRAFLLPFIRHFKAIGYRVDAMAHGITEERDCVDACDRVWNVTWSRNPFTLRNIIGAPERIRRIVAGERYDLVHVHTPVAAFVTRYALRRLQKQGEIKVIYTAHGFHFYQGGHWLKNAVFRTLEKIAGQWTDCLVVINKEDADAAVRYQIIPESRVMYMPGIGVDTAAYAAGNVSAAQVSRLRDQLGLAESDSLFVTVAEFIPRKRHADVLQAFARLQRSDVVLALAGDGPLLESMKKLAVRLDIESRVRFLGYRRDISALMRLARATVLASAQEGLPRSVMESLCLGVPVIGSRIRGVADLLENGAGLLVPLGDVKSIAKAMDWMLSHPAQARQMGEVGRVQMKQYDLTRILEHHEQLYEETMRNSAAPAIRGSARNGVAVEKQLMHLS